MLPTQIPFCSSYSETGLHHTLLSYNPLNYVCQSEVASIFKYFYIEIIFVNYVYALLTIHSTYNIDFPYCILKINKPNNENAKLIFMTNIHRLWFTGLFHNRCFNFVVQNSHYWIENGTATCCAYSSVFNGCGYLVSQTFFIRIYYFSIFCFFLETLIDVELPIDY